MLLAQTFGLAIVPSADSPKQATAGILGRTREIMKQRKGIGKVQKHPLLDYLVDQKISMPNLDQTFLMSTELVGRVARLSA